MTRMMAAVVALGCAMPAAAQVDQSRADTYFTEVAALCAKDAGRLWGRSVCGPIVVSDVATRTMATSEPAPDAPKPSALGFANAAMMWGGVRWATIVWQFIPPDDPHMRGRLFLHELFHRIQPDLGFTFRDAPNDHLDTLDGRYWMQLEWRALGKALGSSGPARASAVRDALAFRAERRRLATTAAESERLLEMNEGLAQYTGTLLSAATPADAIADAIEQLAQTEQAPTFVRTFAYPSGAAYGLLLDAWSPGWQRRITINDDLGALVAAAAKLAPAEHAARAAVAYDAVALRAAEQLRERERQARVAAYQRVFIERPVLVMPNGRGNSFATAGVTPIPGVGTIVTGFRTAAEWGTLEAAAVLMSTDRSTLAVPAPGSIEGTTLGGDGWTLTLASGWVVRPGTRAGDFRVVRE